MKVTSIVSSHMHSIPKVMPYNRNAREALGNDFKKNSALWHLQYLLINVSNSQWEHKKCSFSFEESKIVLPWDLVQSWPIWKILWLRFFIGVKCFNLRHILAINWTPNTNIPTLYEQFTAQIWKTYQNKKWSFLS